MADGYVQVAADGVGKKIDNAELTRDDGVVVERQRVVISSDDNPRIQTRVDGEAGRAALSVDIGNALNSIVDKLEEIRTLIVMVTS